MNAVAVDVRRDQIKKLAVGLLVGLGALAAVVLVGTRLGSDPRVGPEPQRSGKAAPDFTLSMSTGKTVSLADFRGQPLWLTFWTTWCPPCRAEMPDLQDAYQTSPPGRYQYLAINFGEDPVRVGSFLREIGYTLPVAIDPSGDIALTYRIQGLPTHILVDKDGTVRRVYSGVLTRSEMEKWVTNLW